MESCFTGIGAGRRRGNERTEELSLVGSSVGWSLDVQAGCSGRESRRVGTPMAVLHVFRRTSMDSGDPRELRTRLSLWFDFFRRGIFRCKVVGVGLYFPADVVESEWTG
ncbi:hypothetical protein OROMI_017833 [Orobanche minor]